MRRWISHLLAAVAGVPLAMGGIANAATEKAALTGEAAWDAAVSQATLEGFAKFALQYPESIHADEARTMLETAAVAKRVTQPEASAPAGSSEPEFIPGSLMVV